MTSLANACFSTDDCVLIGCCAGQLVTSLCRAVQSVGSPAAGYVLLLQEHSLTRVTVQYILTLRQVFEGWLARPEITAHSSKDSL